MGTITFDTLEATKRLREAGFDEKQAEVVVRVLSDSQERLVTREYFDAKMEAMEMRLTIKLGGFLTAAVGILYTLLKHCIHYRIISYDTTLEMQTDDRSDWWGKGWRR